MAAHWMALLWTVVGIAASLVHLALLRRALLASLNLAPQRAKERVSRGLPFRLLILTPVLVLAARSGLIACIAFVVGSLIGRWLAFTRSTVHKELAAVSSRQG